MNNTKTIKINGTVCAPREILLDAAMINLSHIDQELQNGYEVIKKQHKTVTIFGSARTTEDNPDYAAARKLSSGLASKGYSVVTGGGHGIMEAANRGAFEVGGDSIGFNIKLPKEQTLNKYVTENVSFSYFSPRKIAMTLFADAYIFFPGGFGTFDELCEILTLTQTDKMFSAPIILMDNVGDSFWKPFDNMIRNILLKEDRVISPGDEKIYTVTNDVYKAISLVRSNKRYCNH